MIKSFRKIRQSLVTKNKFSKYLLYAIGEIILVVIGILLALHINNKNEEGINDTKITNILKEIQQDLVSDIERSKQIFDLFIIDDSIQDLILNDKYTYADFKSGHARQLGYDYVDFVINTNGYDNLMRNIDNVPEKYRPILNDLKDLYIHKKSDIEVFNSRIRETVYKNLDEVWNKYNWVLQYRQGLMPDEAINYFLNSQLYKNRVANYINGRRNTFSDSQRYRHKAIETYLKIKDLIGNNNSIHKTLALETNVKSPLHTIASTYRIMDRLGEGWANEIKISIEGTELTYTEGDFKSKLAHHKESIYFILKSSSYIIFNTPNVGELYISASFIGNGTYRKVE